jgi:flagellar protein FlaF
MSITAYQNVQQATEDPRQTEYRLFALVTRNLFEVKDDKGPKRIAALNWNRRVWSSLKYDLAAPTNRFPDALKAKLISIAFWVERYTSQAMRGEVEVQPLIDINRSIMEGLSPSNPATSLSPEAA